VRCGEARQLAARLFAASAAATVTEAKLLRDDAGLLVRTTDVEALYRLLQDLVVAGQLTLESVTPADEDALALYHYLIGTEQLECR
jgi:ABC-2 type transport system ATP-binding protein